MVGNGGAVGTSFSGVRAATSSINVRLTIGKIDNTGGYNLSLQGSSTIATVTSSNSSTGIGVNFFGTTNLLQDSTITEATKTASMVTFGNLMLPSIRETGAIDTHYVYTDGGLISSEASIRHTASGISWKMEPTSTNRSSGYPLPFKIATAACAANTAVTCSAWFRRSNTGLTGKLTCKGGQLSGVSTTSSSMTASADTWEQLSVTVTPTQKGVLEFYAECYGGTTYAMYVDDITISGG